MLLEKQIASKVAGGGWGCLVKPINYLTKCLKKKERVELYSGTPGIMIVANVNSRMPSEAGIYFDELLTNDFCFLSC